MDLLSLTLAPQTAVAAKTITMKLNPDLEELISSLDVSSISETRKAVLQEVSEYIHAKISNSQSVRMNFICTHNSRRSHLSQIWAQALASYFNINNVFCYSGGTEATALFPKIAETISNHGFKVSKLSEGSNPVYSIKYASNEPSIIGFSKEMDHPFNPSSEFLAIMTCSQADEGCPFVPGAEKRISLPFDDPKAFDDTPQQTQKYHERSLQIATELFFVFSNLNK